VNRDLLRAAPGGLPRWSFRTALWPIAAGIVVFAIVALAADVGKVGDALAQFDWRLIPLGLGLTLCNYVLRWARWHVYLRLFAVHVPVPASLAMYLAGLGMAITPGKLGEFVKAYLLQQRTGTAMAVAVPIVVAERTTDGLAMSLLALFGIASLGQGPLAILLAALPTLGLVVLVRWRRAAEWMFANAAPLPLIGNIAERSRDFYETAYALFGARLLLMAIGIGVISWFAEAVALVAILSGLGVPLNAALIPQATGAMAIGTLIGAVSFLPGGLGLAEGGIVGLLLVLVPNVTLAQAAAATLLFRLVTFWFGVSIGMLMLTVLLGRTGRG
jgi:uncharacterized protein (TIRG00374 family)